jgi:hypothetical protein
VTAEPAGETLPPDVLERLREEYEVDIETSRGGGAGPRRTTIWIVAVGDMPYVRAYRGPRARWFADLAAEPIGAIHVAGSRIPFRSQPVTDAETLGAVDKAFLDKYRGDPSTPLMVTPEAVPATLRLLTPPSL